MTRLLALVWPERPGLPADPSTGVGLLISQFRGDVDEGYTDAGVRLSGHLPAGIAGEIAAAANRRRADRSA